MDDGDDGSRIREMTVHVLMAPHAAEAVERWGERQSSAAGQALEQRRMQCDPAEPQFYA